MRIAPVSVKLLAITPNSAQLIEAAGRTCYKSEDKITDDSADKFIEMIAKRGHASVIEHAYATFRIVTDRGITHEIVRHRLASYSQESTRYCNYAKDKFGEEITVICPHGLVPGSVEHGIWLDAMNHVETGYFKLISYGYSPQIARSVLPTCLKTEIVMTANFREWNHFLTLRLDRAAHPDMRRVAYLIWLDLAAQCRPIFATGAHLLAIQRCEEDGLQYDGGKK